MMGHSKRVDMVVDEQSVGLEFFDDGDMIIEDMEKDQVCFSEHAAIAMARAILKHYIPETTQ